MPRRGASFVTGLSVGQIDPMRAAIERHAEALRVGDAAAADMIGRFEQHVTPAGGGDLSRRGDAGRAGADDDDIDRARESARSPAKAGRAASAAEAARNERRLSRGIVCAAWFPNAFGRRTCPLPSRHICRERGQGAVGEQTLRLNFSQ